MARGDADYRGEPCLDFTYDILEWGYDPGPVIPGIDPRDPNINLACAETKENIQISDTSPKAFWRVQGDHVANQAYQARRFNIVINDPDDCAVILTNIQGFHAYVTVNRTLTIWWQGVPDANGVFKFTVGALQTGPMTVEVTTLEPYDQGSFDIELDCHYSAPAVLYIYLDSITTAAWLALDASAVSQFFRVPISSPDFHYVANNSMGNAFVGTITYDDNYLVLANGGLVYLGVDRYDFLTVYNLIYGVGPPIASFSLTP
jgi:hypothetical protein